MHTEKGGNRESGSLWERQQAWCCWREGLGKDSPRKGPLSWEESMGVDRLVVRRREQTVKGLGVWETPQ